CRVNTGWGTTRSSTYRSPGGPPPGPTSPSPDSGMRVPESTPAGILMVSDRRVRTLPSPEHSPHGRGLTVPYPWHCGHGRVVITWPRNDRCTWLTSPWPPHVGQVVSDDPGAVPSPLHAMQTIAVSTCNCL